MSLPPVSSVVRRVRVRLRTIALAAFAVFGVSSACTEGRIPTGPSPTQPSTVSLSLNATVSSAGRAIKVVAFYARTGSPGTRIFLDSTVVSLTGTETTLPVRLDVAPCLADPLRELPAGVSLEEGAQICVMYLVLSLYDANNRQIDQQALPAIAARPGVSAAAPPVVLGSTVQSITLSPRTLTINAIGFAGVITAVVTDQLNQPIAGPSLSYLSLAPAIATVDSTGRVTARGTGTTRIVGTSRNRADTVTVTVRQVLKSVTITGPTSPLVLGDSAVVLGIARDSADAAIPAGIAPVQYTTTNASVVSVDAATGRIRAVGVGSATIGAAVGTVGANIALNVILAPVATISVTPPSSNIRVGQTVSLTAVTRDASGNVVTGRVVTWATSDTAVASVSATGVVTAKRAGSATITAASEGKSGTATVTVTSVPVSRVDITPATPTVTVGETITLAATARDSAGNPLAGRPVTWTSSDPSIATVSSSGVVAGLIVGQVTISAESEGKTGSVSVSVFGANMAVVTQPAGTVTGALLSAQPVVRIIDTAGNTITSYNGPVVATLTGPGSLTGTTLVNAVNGVATFTDLRVTGSGSFQLQFASSATPPLLSAVFTISALPPTQLAVVTQPAGAASGAPFTTQPIIEVRDANGALVTNAVDPVTVSIRSGNGGGTLSGTLTVNAVGGRASFTNLRISATGSYTLTFASGSLTSADAAPLTVTASPPTQLVVATAPGGATTGSPLSPQPVVEVRDANNAVVAGATNQVTATLNGGGGTLQGTTTVAAVNGVATFTDLRVSGSGTYTLTFSSVPLAPATSGAFVISALPPTQLTVGTQPGGAQTGSPLNPQPTVQVRDVNGGIVAGSAAAVTATLSGGGGTLSGTTTVSAVNGVATFTNLTVTGVGSYTLTFTSGTLSAVTSNAFGVTALPPTQLILTTQPSGAQTGAPLSTQPVVRVADGTGSAVAGATNAVTAMLNGAGGTLSGTTTVNAVNGVATFTDLVVTGAGSYSITFSAAGLTSTTSNTIAISALPPTRLGVSTQPGGAVSNSPLAPQPVVHILDANGGIVTGSSAVVIATLNGAGGTLSGTTAVSAVNGVATFTNLVVTGPGSYTLTFTSTGLTPVTSGAFGITAQPPTQVGIATQPGGAPSTAFLNPQPVLEIRNASGNVVAGATNAVTATLNGAGGTLFGTTTVNAVNGVATFADLHIGGAGTYTITFTSAGLTPVTSAPIVITALPPTQLALGTQPGGAVSGSPLAPQPVVQVLDQNGDVVTTSTVAVTAALNGAGGTLSGTTTVNAVNGIATFTNLVVTGPGTYTLTFTSSGLTPVTSGSVGITAQPPTQVAITTQPGGAQTGAPLAPQPVVEIRNASNVVVAGSTAAVTATLNGAGGTLSGTTTVNAVNGVATFTDLVVTGPGSYTITFAAAGLTPSTSGAVVITALPPTQLGLATQPGGAVSNSPLAPQPVVHILDANGGIVTGSSAVVIATLNGAGGTLSGTTAVSAVNGVATFTNLVVTGPGSYTLTFTSTGLTPVTSGAFGITAQPPTQVGIATQPGGAPSTAFLNPQPVLEIRNASGNVVAGATNAVTATLNGAGGTLFGTTTVNAVNGVATFADLHIGGAGTYTITFTSAGLTPVTSAPIVITALPPTQLALGTQPGGAVSGSPLAPQPVVQVLDQNGDVVTTSTVAVTAALNGAGGTLSGTTTVNAVNGIATFTNLVVTGPGTYTLTFTSSGLTPVTSGSVGITAQPPTQVAITTQPGGAQTGAPLAPQPVVEIRNASNVVVAGSTAAVTATLNGAGGTLSGTTTVNAVNGVATFTDLVVTGTGTYTLTFSSSSLASATSANFTIVAVPPTQLAITTQPGDAPRTSPLSPQPVVEIRSASNGPVSSNAQVTATLSGGGTLSGTTTVNAVNGVATFTDLAVTSPAGTYTITFTSAGLTSATSTSFTITAAPPTQLFVTMEPGGAVTGSPLNPQPVVAIRDAFGQTVAGATGAVTATLNGAGGTLSGMTTVDATNGVATFTDLVVTGTGSFTLTFTSPGLTARTSQAFVITAQPPSQVVITTPPGGAQTGSPLAPQPVVEIRNASNAVVAGSTAAVTATLNGAGGTLSGTTTVNAVNGVATFTDLVVTGAGSYTLTFSSGGLTPATSGSITITPPPPADIKLNVGASATANGTQGTNLPIPINVDMSNAQGQNLSSLSFNVTWDPTKFDFVSVTNGSFGASGSYFTNSANAASGSIAVSVFDNTGFSTGSFTIYTVTLKPKASASGTPVTVNVTAAGDDIGNTIPNSKFTVRPLAVTTP